jgi:hypothetical protein
LALAVVGSFNVSIAPEPKAIVGDKEVASSNGMKLFDCSSGSFMMGSSVEEKTRFRSDII